jgi:hypothetical protein
VHRRIRRGAVHQPEDREEELHGAVHQPSPPAPAAAGTKPRASATPTPAISRAFRAANRSPATAIAARSSTRNSPTKSQNLEKAKKALFDAGNQPPDKLQPLRDTVALHERNVEALKKELGNLR